MPEPHRQLVCKLQLGPHRRPIDNCPVSSADAGDDIREDDIKETKDEHPDEILDDWYRTQFLFSPSLCFRQSVSMITSSTFFNMILRFSTTFRS